MIARTPSQTNGSPGADTAIVGAEACFGSTNIMHHCRPIAEGTKTASEAEAEDRSVSCEA